MHVIKGDDGRLWFRIGKHRITYYYETLTGLDLASQDNPIVIADPYIRAEGTKDSPWINVKEKITARQRRRWRTAILPLELERIKLLEGGDS